MTRYTGVIIRKEERGGHTMAAADILVEEDKVMQNPEAAEGEVIVLRV